MLVLTEKTHSNNSKIAEKINKNLIFWIINLIKTVAVDITSNSDSLKKLFPEAEPLIYTKKEIPKSKNKLVGIVKIKSVIKTKLDINQLNIFVCIIM